MTPQEFIAKWRPVQLTERSACQQHFLDLCELLVQPKPAAADPEGAWYTFERGVSKAGGGMGWADVWMRGHFGWEYKGKHKDLVAAYRQLLLYREDLDNPPLLVVCDLDRFEVHTNFTGTAKRRYEFDLEGLAEPANLDVLRKLFTDPDALRPGQTTESVTRLAAERFGLLADGMRIRGISALSAAHFLMKLIFCMFAEDIGLLPPKLFNRILLGAKSDPPRLATMLGGLFEAMARGGDFGADPILFFNGGLFADADVIELRPDEIKELLLVNEHDWGSVEPSIFGTLFERTLDPAKRSQIGAHYTSRDDILTLLEPVVMVPLRREWDEVKAKCEKLAAKFKVAAGGKRAPAKDSKARKDHDRLIQDFVERLAHVSILDPACGSGNFLYVAINLLLDLEKEVITYAAARGLGMLPHVRPTQLAGIEINPYAQQLAQVVIWIGYLQWMHDNGFNAPRDPVLEPIESIRLMDAIIDLSDPEHPREPEWPAADFIVGNPPFVGGNKIRAELGDAYVERLFRLYEGRVPAFADLCCYWFEKAQSQIVAKRSSRTGLLATQGIRGGVNRDVLDRIKASGGIFFAVGDRDWILDGASVHVSLIGFDDGSEQCRELDGMRVLQINTNLTSHADITEARRLAENADICCYGSQQKAKLDISPELAIEMLRQPNPNGRPNSDVVRPSFNGKQVLRRTHESYVIDFGLEDHIDAAARYEMPFEFVREHVYPDRKEHRELRQRNYWWLHARPSPRYRAAIKRLSRYFITPTVSKHRVFVWMPTYVLVDHQTLVFTQADESLFGVLHSRIHEVWSRAQATQVRERESGLRYTPSSCFDTFARPVITPPTKAAISAAALELDQLRSTWLNPHEWTREEILEFPGSADGPWARYVHEPDGRGIGVVRYPRLVAQDAECAKQLAKRTLTNLYNQRPAWLDAAHRRLDEAVFAAYGWPADLSDEEILAKLLKLNLSREPES